MKSDLNNKTVLELKEICKKKELKGYSKLCKDNLVKMLSKNLKKGGDPTEKIIVCDYRINNYCTKSYDINNPELYINKLVKIVNHLKQLDNAITNRNNSYKTSLKEKKCKEQNPPTFFGPSDKYKLCLSSTLRTNNMCSNSSSLKKSDECKLFKIYKEGVSSAEYHRNILSNIISVVKNSKYNSDRYIFYKALSDKGITNEDIDKYFKKITYSI